MFVAKGRWPACGRVGSVMVKVGLFLAWTSRSRGLMSWRRSSKRRLATYTSGPGQLIEIVGRFGGFGLD